MKVSSGQILPFFSVPKTRQSCNCVAVYGMATRGPWAELRGQCKCQTTVNKALRCTLCAAYFVLEGQSGSKSRNMKSSSNHAELQIVVDHLALHARARLSSRVLQTVPCSSTKNDGWKQKSAGAGLLVQRASSPRRTPAHNLADELPPGEPSPSHRETKRL